MLLHASVAGAAEPGPDVERARDAYDRGVRAHAAGDHAAAAVAFADADKLAPTAASLEAALEAAMRADDAALGAELLERAEARPERDASLSKTIDAAKSRFAGRAGKIRVQCKESDLCLVAVDGRALDASRPIWTTVGAHTVIVQREHDRIERLVQVDPGAVTVVSAAGDAPAFMQAKAGGPNTPRAEARGGVSPVWFWIGLGATAVAGGAATISGLAALADHDDFVARGCGRGGTGPVPSDCNRLSDAGGVATLRTNLLIGLTGLLAVNTAVLGAVFVRWSPAPGGGGVAVVQARLP